MPGFNPIPSSIQISRMLRRQPPVTGIGFKSGVTQHPFPLRRADGGRMGFQQGGGPAGPMDYAGPIGPPTLEEILHRQRLVADAQRGRQRGEYMPNAVMLQAPTQARGGRIGRDIGGGIPDNPLTPVIGAINTATPGRADAHQTHVPPDSYVMPADIVSMMGEGNTAAGFKMLAKMFLPLQAQSGQQIALMGQGAPYGASGSAPYGAQMPNLRTKAMLPPRPPAPYSPPAPKFPSFGAQAQGGVVPPEAQRPGTPINISGGEFTIPPAEVKRRGRGDINRGHEILDAWVRALRAEHIKTLQKLPGPAK